MSESPKDQRSEEIEEDLIEAPERPFLLDLINDDRLTPIQERFLRLRYEDNLPEEEVARLLELDTVEDLRNFERMTFRHIRAFRDPIMEGAFDEDE